MTDFLKTFFQNSVNSHFDLFFKAIEESFESVEIIDPQGKTLYVNDRFEKNTGFSKKEVVGKPSLMLCSPKHSEGFYQEIWKTLHKGEIWNGVLLTSQKKGESLIEKVRLSPFKNDHGEIIGYIALKLNITEKTHLQEEIENINHIKNEFVSLSSHQLRTPLTTINWYLEMILGGEMGEVPPEQKKFLEKVYESAQKMVELVNQLLMISRLESEKIKPHFEKIDLCAIVKKVLEKNEKFAQEKKCKIAKERPEGKEHFFICSDAELCENMIHNIIHNGIKYSEGGNLKISVTENEKQVLMKIKDEGMGIPKQFYEKMFKKFSRAENAHTKETEGTGIGLYLSRLISQNLQGSLWFESEIDKGSTFFIALPKSDISLCLK